MVIEKTVEKVWICRIFIVFLVCGIYVWTLSVTGWINSNYGCNLMMTFIGSQNIFQLQILLYFNFASMTLTLKWNSWLHHKHAVNLTVCSYHVTYVFQSESTLYSCLNVKELLAQSRRIIWSLSDCNLTRTQNHLVNEHSTIWPNWPNDWAMLWVLISTVHLTVCYYHVTYTFQS